MKYKLPDIDLSSDVFLYCGGSKRKATATDVIFINPNLILVSSLLGRKIYLIDITDNQFNIIDEIEFDGYVDLMDYKDGILCTANAKYKKLKSSYSIFKIENNKIIHIKTTDIEIDVRLHGVLFIDESNIILGSNDERHSGLYFVNLKNEKIYNTIKMKLRIKDICFYKDFLLVVGSETSPSGTKVDVTKSVLYQYDFKTLKLINTLEIKGQADAFCMNGDDGFITLQCEHSVAHFKFENEKPILIKYIKGFDFPHGIDINYDKVCVTNYGTNSVDILNYNEFIWM